MDLPPLSEALAWLQQYPSGRAVGQRLIPTACVLALWLRDWCGAEHVSIDDDVVRVRWASGWRLTCPTPADYARVLELIDWSCGPVSAMTITVSEAEAAIGQALRETYEEE